MKAFSIFKIVFFSLVSLLFLVYILLHSYWYNTPTTIITVQEYFYLVFTSFKTLVDFVFPLLIAIFGTLIFYEAKQLSQKKKRIKKQ